ncbi:MAG: hypothetical protein Kow0069_06880 [Promethearchaeota archaeon]
MRKLSFTAFATFATFATVAAFVVPLGLSAPTPSSPNPADGEPTTGQQVVDYFRQVFRADWERGTPYDPDVDGLGLAKSRDVTGSPNYQRKAPALVETNASITPVLSPDNSEDAIVDLISRANDTLLIQQMYVYSDLSSVVDAIKAAAARGVNACVLLGEGSDSTNRPTAEALVAAGVKVRECDGTAPLYFDVVHNKGVIVDHVEVLVSSINWSPTSLRDNREAALLVRSAKVASYYEVLFNRDWAGSDPYDPSTSFLSSLPTPSPPPSPPVPFPAHSTPSPSPPRAPPRSAEYLPLFPTLQTFAGEVNLTLASSPDNAYEVLVNEIAQAEESIDVSVYTFSSPFVMDAVAERIAHGVKVRLLLGKPLGSWEMNYNRWTLANFTAIGIPSASGPGNLTAQGRWADPDFDYQHCKYAIVDNDTLVLSSGNWSQNSCPAPDEDGEVYGNRDWWIVVYGSSPSELPGLDGGAAGPRDVAGPRASLTVAAAAVGLAAVASHGASTRRRR